MYPLTCKQTFKKKNQNRIQDIPENAKPSKIGCKKYSLFHYFFLMYASEKSNKKINFPGFFQIDPEREKENVRKEKKATYFSSTTMATILRPY